MVKLVPLKIWEDMNTVVIESVKPNSIYIKRVFELEKYGIDRNTFSGEATFTKVWEEIGGMTNFEFIVCCYQTN